MFGLDTLRLVFMFHSSICDSLLLIRLAASVSKNTPPPAFFGEWTVIYELFTKLSRNLCTNDQKMLTILQEQLRMAMLSQE